MQEYFNLDIENNFNLKSPKEIKDSALLESSYSHNNIDGPITIMTPPLRCSKVKVWPSKNDMFSKCIIELETTESEWRFTQFLTEIGDKCRFLITENAKKWFKYTFSASSMNDSYSNLFINKYNDNQVENIQIQLGKNLLNNLDKQTAKSYRNQYVVLRLVFKGILVSNGKFSEIWRADQIYKSKQSYDSDDFDIDDNDDEEISEKPLEKEEVKPLEKEEVKALEKEEVKPLEEKEVKPLEEKEVEPLEEKEVEPLVEKEVEPLVEKEVEKPLEEKKEKPKSKRIIISNNRRRKL